jgi:hypothetical protein
VAPPSESAGQIHVQAHHHHQPPVDGRVATKLALGPLIIAAVAVAVVVLVATSRKGLGAALAGLGIAGVVLSMIVYSAREKQMIQEVAPVRVATWANSNITQEHDELKPTTQVPSASSTGEAAAAETTAEADAPPSDTSAKAEADDKPDVSEKPKERPVAESPKAKDAGKTSPPAWINDEPTMENGVYRAAMVSGPYSTRRECEAHLDDSLRKAMMEYADSYLSPSTRYAAWADIGYVRNNMIEDRYFAEEQYENIAGKMYNLHVRLKIEQRDVARFAELARHHEERRAVETASAGGIFVFGTLVVLYGGLRFLGRKKRTKPAESSPTAPAEATV